MCNRKRGRKVNKVKFIYPIAHTDNIIDILGVFSTSIPYHTCFYLV